MNIIYPEHMSKKEIYDMTRSPAIKRMSDAVGEVLTVSALYMRDEVNPDGEVKEVCSIMTEKGEVYATNSRTFITSMNSIINIGFPQKVEIVSGTSRNGRKYIDVVCLEFTED